MLEEIKSDIAKLIALYEAEKQRADSLAERVSGYESEVRSCKEQITELNHQIDNLKLMSAFSGDGNNAVAKKRIEKLIKEIDKCIDLLEN